MLNWPNGLCTPYRLTIRNRARLFHIVLFYISPVQKYYFWKNDPAATIVGLGRGGVLGQGKGSGSWVKKMDSQKVCEKPQFRDQFDVGPLWMAITQTLEVQLTFFYGKTTSRAWWWPQKLSQKPISSQSYKRSKYSHEVELLSLFLQNGVIILVFTVFASTVRILAAFF